jgi:hypothetical protein
MCCDSIGNADEDDGCDLQRTQAVLLQGPTACLASHKTAASRDEGSWEAQALERLGPAWGHLVLAVYSLASCCWHKKQQRRGLLPSEQLLLALEAACCAACLTCWLHDVMHHEPLPPWTPLRGRAVP